METRKGPKVVLTGELKFVSGLQMFLSTGAGYSPHLPLSFTAQISGERHNVIITVTYLVVIDDMLETFIHLPDKTDQ